MEVLREILNNSNGNIENYKMQKNGLYKKEVKPGEKNETLTVNELLKKTGGDTVVVFDF